jgi:hypothetical protein
MILESENFIIDKLQLIDKDNVRVLEESRPWARAMFQLNDSLLDGNRVDYFDKLWREYQTQDYFWCIYRKDGQFCGDIQLDRDSNTEYHLYIQIMDDVCIDGIGIELFDSLIDKIVEESGARHLEFELWNENDPSKAIFDELGIELDDGELIYDC